MTNPIDWDAELAEQEKDPGFQPVPADKYRVRIDKAEAVTAGTGADMLKLTAKIVGGPYDSKLLFTNIVFKPGNASAMRFTFRKLAALGVSQDTLRATKPSMPQLASMVEGTEAEAEVTIDNSYDGTDRNDIKSFRSLLPGGTSVPAPPPVPAAPEIPKPTIPDASASTPEPF